MGLTNLPFELFIRIMEHVSTDTIHILKPCRNTAEEPDNGSHWTAVTRRRMDVAVDVLDALLGIRNRVLRDWCRHDHIMSIVFDKYMWHDLKKSAQSRFVDDSAMIYCAGRGAINVFELCLDIVSSIHGGDTWNRRAFVKRRTEIICEALHQPSTERIIAVQENIQMTTDPADVAKLFQEQSCLIRIREAKMAMTNHLFDKYAARVPAEFYFKNVADRLCDCYPEMCICGDDEDTCDHVALECYRRGSRLYVDTPEVTAKCLPLVTYLINEHGYINDMDISVAIACYHGHWRFVEKFVVGNVLSPLYLEIAVLGGQRQVLNVWLHFRYVSVETESMLRLFAGRAYYAVEPTFYAMILEYAFVQVADKTDLFRRLFQHHCDEGCLERLRVLCATEAVTPDLVVVALERGAVWAAQFLFSEHGLEAPEGYRLPRRLQEMWRYDMMDVETVNRLLEIGALDADESLAYRIKNWMQGVSVHFDQKTWLLCLRRPRLKAMVYAVARTFANSNEVFESLIDLCVAPTWSDR